MEKSYHYLSIIIVRYRMLLALQLTDELCADQQFVHRHLNQGALSVRVMVYPIDIAGILGDLRMA